MSSRNRVGYMSQSFSLYTELTVRQNLDLHARLFHLPPQKAKARIAELVARFRPRRLCRPARPRSCRSASASGSRSPSPSSTSRRCSSSTSRPRASIRLARDRFWELLIDLSRNQGVTIFVSTHFMNEAERCDRISLMDSGRVLATDTPAESRQGPRRRHARGRLHRLSRGGNRSTRLPRPSELAPAGETARSGAIADAWQRSCSACSGCSPTPSARRLELLRDPIRLGFGLFGTAFLMLVFGFGISTDVNNLSFAVLDRDRSHESRAYLEELRGSRLFRRETAARRLCRSREASPEREHQGGYRNPARLRSRHHARTSRLGRRLGRWRNAVPGRDDPRLSAGHASVVSGRSGGEDDGTRRQAACRDRSQVQVQSGFRQHLCDGAFEHLACCSRCFRRS